MSAANFDDASRQKETPKRLGTTIAPVLPFAGAAIAGGSLLLMGGPAYPIAWASILVERCTYGAPEAYGATTIWLAATYALVVAGLVNLTVVVESVGHALRAPWCPPRTAWLLKGTGIALVLAAVVLHFVDGRAGPTVLGTIEQHGVAQVKATFQTMDGAYKWGGFASALGLSATLAPVASQCRDLEVLADALRRQQRILYATSLVLACASVWMNALWSWPRIWARTPEALFKIEQLANQVSGSWGAIFTVFTLAVFSLANLALRDWIAKVGRERYPEVKERHDRLDELGLKATWAQEISSVAAVLGPALAGGPGALVFQAIGK